MRLVCLALLVTPLIDAYSLLCCAAFLHAGVRLMHASPLAPSQLLHSPDPASAQPLLRAIRTHVALM
jgi:hypothetical protein